MMTFREYSRQSRHREREKMIVEHGGKKYRFIRGSDVVRDGMFFEAVSKPDLYIVRALFG